MYANQQAYWPSCRQASTSAIALTRPGVAVMQGGCAAHLKQVRVDVSGFQDPSAQLAREHHVPIHGLSSNGRHLCNKQVTQ